VTASPDSEFYLIEFPWAIRDTDRKTVNLVLEQAVKAGGVLLKPKPARDADWRGYSGYFADPDGHPWEVAWNPFFVIEQGNPQVID
jgi:uncharacterized protein